MLSQVRKSGPGAPGKWGYSGSQPGKQNGNSGSALPPEFCKRLLGHPAGDCVREAVAVSSEGGAVEEGEVEAGEAVHGLPQEGGGPD